MSLTDIQQCFNVVNSVSSLKVYSLTYTPHYLHPNNTLFLNANDQDVDDLICNPSLGIEATYPVQLPLASDINSIVEENIAVKLVQEKQAYIHEVERLAAYCKRKKPSVKKTKGKIYSMQFNKLMEMTTKDPDPYFFGAYNWYYTGGALETASIYDDDFLFYVSGPKLNIFNSAKVLANKDTLQLEHLDSMNQTNCDTIFEIIKSEFGNVSCVAARQKNHFTVFHLQNESAQDYRCERDIPFMSGTFAGDCFYTIDAKHVIQRIDLEENKEYGRMYLKLPKKNNYWCQLRTYNNQLVFANTDKLKIYDTRLFAKKASKCMELCMDSITEKCEKITCVRTDSAEHNVFVATTHNLFVFDVRYGMETGNELARYTHQMKTPPLMIDATGGGPTGDAANHRLIALSGTFTDDISIAQHGMLQNNKLRNNNIPQKILSMSDAYKKLRENGLQPEAANLLNKNRLVNIGARFVRLNSNLFLLSEKSSGEIFYQKITPDVKEFDQDQEIDDKLFRNLDLREENQVSAKPAEVTTVTNFDSIKRILKYNLPNDSEVPDTDMPQSHKWQQSLEQLASYKDMLSADLLNVWNDLQITQKDDKTDKTEFVSGWINKSTAGSRHDSDLEDDL